MLLIGTPDIIPNIPIVVYNFSSYVEGLPRIELLPPNRTVLNTNEELAAYMNYIMNNNDRFMELMKIIIPLYEGKDVFICVTRNEYFDSILEGLTQLIKIRYSYNAQELYTPEDLFNLNYESSFNTREGLANLDIDKERWSKLAAVMYTNTNGDIMYGN